MKSKPDQNRVIKEVLEFISNIINVEYEITGHPDEIERKLPACDALAIMGSRNVAIEHTSIDSFLFQRRNDSRFMRIFGPLGKELSGRLPTNGRYQLLIHTNVIPTGIGWDDIRRRIDKWCQKVAPRLEAMGTTTARGSSISERAPEVPFEVTLYRSPRRGGQFGIARFSPEDLEDQRKKVIHKAISSRGTKVSTYRDEGFRTILVLESDDIALANTPVIGGALVAIISEFESTRLPDEIYLVETESEPHYVTCMKFEDSLFPNANISKRPYIT